MYTQCSLNVVAECSLNVAECSQHMSLLRAHARNPT
jgi:hypothetical protein